MNPVLNYLKRLFGGGETSNNATRELKAMHAINKLAIIMFVLGLAYLIGFVWT